ncbi:MAG: DUF4013 domain-containing protein [Anaerolineales bacterium]
MDYIGAVTYVANDKNWLKKIGLGALMALLSFVLVGAWALTGWAMEAFRRVVSHAEEKLPDWDNLGGYIGQGFKYFVVTLVWGLPMILIITVLLMVGAFAASGAENSGFALVGTTLAIWLLAMVYGLVVGFLSLGAFAVIAQTDSLGQALNPANAWQVINRDLGKWALSYLVLILASAVLSLVGSALCGIGAFVATPWIYATMGNLLGQTFVEAGREF